MTLLDEGTASIQAALIALEDRAAPSIALQEVVKNLYVGVLDFIRARNQENPSFAIGPKPSRTDPFAGLEVLRRRFVGRGVELDWERVVRLALEWHRASRPNSEISRDGAVGMLVEALSILREFAALAPPVDLEAQLGDRCYRAILHLESAYGEERAKTLAAIRAMSWGSPMLAAAMEAYPCPKCGSLLTYPFTSSVPSRSGLAQRSDPAAQLDDRVMICRTCKHAAPADEFVGLALAKHCAFRAHRAETVGKMGPLTICDECVAETYVIEEGRCARCGNQFS